MIPDGTRRSSVPRSITILAASAIVLALASCGGGDEAPTCESPKTAASVAMDDFVYEPGCVEVAPGAELEIVNDGKAPHTFTVEADVADAEVDVPAGERATLTIPALEVGRYRVVCSYHPEMEGALRITG